jgi:hypothetical protein
MKTLEQFHIQSVLEMHMNQQIPIRENLFRLESDAYYALIEEARAQYVSGELVISDTGDQLLLERLQTGKSGVWKGKKVKLDTPRRIPNAKAEGKKFEVYTSTGKRDADGMLIAKRIRWGDPNLKIKNYDEKARKSFWARHKCDTKRDPLTPGFWACWAPTLFGKQLGLSSTAHW